MKNKDVSIILESRCGIIKKAFFIIVTFLLVYGVGDFTNSMVNAESIQQVETDSDTDIPVSKPVDPVKNIITAGSKYIGNSVYVFGGGRTENDIANGRFDCSSFVHWAFRQAGVVIGTTTDTIKNNGRQISTSELQPGDLVFFDTYKKDGHVGIYIGNNKFLGSQSSTGVAIADMNNEYWKKRFNGRVIRIIE